MSANGIIAWAVSSMLAWSPVAEAKRARYEMIAADAAIVVFDPAEKPLYAGERGRVKTLAMVLSIASFESNFLEEVELGHVRGDHGASWCLMQVSLSKEARIVLKGDVYGYAYSREQGWSGEDLAGDRQKCFRAALHMMRESIRGCGDLSLYTSGACRQKERASEHRMKRAQWALTRTTLSDVDF